MAHPGTFDARYIGEVKYDGKNNTTLFETPEQGVAVWLELLRRYRAVGADSVGSIIKKYGGGQSNYESEYLPPSRNGLASRLPVRL